MVNGGQKSPAEELEPLLVSMLVQLAKLRSLLNNTEALELANSVIKGTKLE